jgi:hypothetical protein
MQILKSSSLAIFTGDSSEKNAIILANEITIDELNKK